MRSFGVIVGVTILVSPVLAQAPALRPPRIVQAELSAMYPDASTSVPKDQLVGYYTLRSVDLRRDLYYLASDATQGRMSLSPGNEKAIAWIADEFAGVGLQPAARDADGRPSFLQPVKLVEFTPDPSASRFATSQAGQSREWGQADVQGTFKRAVEMTAPVVFAGYGITAPELGYDDYAGLDVRGKIVMIFPGEPQENDPASIFNGKGASRYGTAQVKMKNALARGAVAVMVAPKVDGAPSMAPMLAAVAKVWGGFFDAPKPYQALRDDAAIPQVRISEAMANALLAASRTDTKTLQAQIDRTLKSRSFDLPRTTFTLKLRNLTETVGTTYNVVALLPGSDETLSKETILIGAHHDHDGMKPCKDGAPPPADVRTDKPCPMIWHGADDNGSGTVGVVALARAFAVNPHKPKRSVLFSVFASEERGLLGAYWMAANPLRPLKTTRAMINFDMIGRNEERSVWDGGFIDIPADTTNRLNIIGGLYSPDYSSVIRQANAATGLVLDDRFDRDTSLNMFFRSDQFPFVLHDVPALWWSTGFHRDYHVVSDTPEKINYPKMEKILKLAYLTTWRLASDVTSPRFIPNPMQKN